MLLTYTQLFPLRSSFAAERRRKHVYKIIFEFLDKPRKHFTCTKSGRDKKERRNKKKTVRKRRKTTKLSISESFCAHRIPATEQEKPKKLSLCTWTKFYQIENDFRVASIEWNLVKKQTHCKHRRPYTLHGKCCWIYGLAKCSLEQGETEDKIIKTEKNSFERKAILCFFFSWRFPTVMLYEWLKWENRRVKKTKR